MNYGASQADSTTSRVCSAACYECLLSYTNQNEHRFIDRNLIKDFLIQLKSSETFAISQQRNRLEQYEWLKKHIDPASPLEVQFLDYLYNSGYRLPDYAQFLPAPEIQVQPDFYYDRGDVPSVCIFVDGPSHDSPETKQHDSQLGK